MTSLSQKIRHTILPLVSLGFILAAQNALAITVLFPVTDSTSPTPGETYRINLIESFFGVNTVFLVDATAPNLAINTKLSDVVYINSEISSSTIKDALRDSCIGVVLEEGQLVDDFGIASRAGKETGTGIDIIDNSHPITAPFAINSLQLFTEPQSLFKLEGTIAPAILAQTLATRILEPDQIAMAYLEIGDALYDVGTAAGRRVFLPWGSQMNFSAISTLHPNGETIMHNAIQWAAAATGCNQLTKMAYLADGTPLRGDGTETLPRGTEIQFIIYLNNPDAAQSDVGVRDVLDPAFAYQNGSIRTTTMAACTNVICSASEEQQIYNAVSSAGLRSDAPDGGLPGGDEVSYTAGNLTVEAGNQIAANDQLDVNANTLWALLFEARIAQ